MTIITEIDLRALVTGLEWNGDALAMELLGHQGKPGTNPREVLVRILNGTLFELAQLSRQRAGLPPLPQDDQTQGFMTQAVLSLSDAQIYPAPLAFELKDFTQVQASVFQVARAPGKNIVYLGCALLILGVFAMLYVRERRVWIWVAPQGDRTHATMALSTNRKTMDGDQEFVQLAQKLIGARPREGTT